MVMGLAFYSERPRSDKDLSFPREFGNHQWCIYDDEVAWKSGIDSLQAISVGGLTYSSGSSEDRFHADC